MLRGGVTTRRAVTVSPALRPRCKPLRRRADGVCNEPAVLASAWPCCLPLEYSLRRMRRVVSVLLHCLLPSCCPAQNAAPLRDAQTLHPLAWRSRKRHLPKLRCGGATQMSPLWMKSPRPVQFARRLGHWCC
jgi:hypothetical protein